MRRFRLVRRGGIFNPLYDEARLDSPIRRGLNWILAANVFGTIFGIICGGGTAAMVGLAGSMGAGDMEFGLLVAIPQIAALLQIPFSIVVNRTRKRKLYILTVGLISRMLWVTFGFLPLISRVPGSMLPLYTLITLLGLSSAMGAMINVCWFPWFSDLTPIRIRGRWLSLRDTILAVASLLSGLMVAWLLDILPVESKYISIFLIGGVMGMMDMICFAPVPEVWAAAPRKISIRHTFKEAMQNKPFLQLVIVWTAWCFTANLSGAYLTPYAMNSMGLNFMQITIFGTVAASVATVVAVPKWGQTLDRFGAKNVMLIGCVGASLTPAFYLLSTPGNVLPTLLHNAVGALFWSAANLAANNMQLSSSPDESRPTYIALFSCITALVGVALGTMCGGWLLEWSHSAGWFTGSFDRYKALILLSVVLRFGFTLLLVPRMPADGEGTLRDAIRFVLHPKKIVRQ